MAHRAGERLEGCSKRRIPDQRERSHRIAMIGALEGDQVGASGMLARGLESALDRLGAAVSKVDAAKAGRQSFGQPCGEARLRLDDVFAVNHYVEMAAGLCGECRKYGRIAVAQGAHADAGDKVEIAAAVSGVNPRTLRVIDFETDRRVGSLREVMEEVVACAGHRKLGGLVSKRRNTPPP